MNQFKSHIRALVGLPFGNVELRQPSMMVNLIGQGEGGPAVLEGKYEAYNDPNIEVHDYGKILSKPGRKMGHFTVIDNTQSGALERAKKARKILRFTGENKSK